MAHPWRAYGTPPPPPPPPPQGVPMSGSPYPNPPNTEQYRWDSQHRRRSRSPNRHGYRRSPPYSDRRDRDYSSRYYDDYQQQDRRRRYRRYEDEQPAPPNINVVLRNLPDSAEEDEIQRTLDAMEASVDEVTLIRDRNTGESRKFAFVRFTSVGHAIQFVEKHYPHFYMGQCRVRVDYCHKDGGREDKIEWRCPRCNKFNDESRRLCVECRTPFEHSKAQKRSKETESMEINDGAKDVSYSANNMLLLRNLDNLSSEESIYQAVEGFRGIRRALLIRDKLTKMSCGFAFLEFDNPELATEAMARMGDNFTVDNSKPNVSYASPESFIPVYVSSEWAVQADIPEGLWMYRDEQAYASEFSPRIIQERQRKEEERRKAEEERKAKEEESKKKADKVAVVAEDSLEDDLSAFYANMGDILADDNDDSAADIFSVPKV